MNILFIKHHSRHSKGTGRYPLAVNSYPPLGLVYLATVLKNDEKSDLIQILDSQALNLSLEQTKERIIKFNPDIICITTMTETIPGAIEIGVLCKELFPEKLRIIGGPHMSVDPEEIMNLDVFQIGVIGEGEATLLEVVNQYRVNKKIPTKIAGTIVKVDGKIIKNSERPRIKDLDVIPFPDRHFLENNLYGPYLALKPWTYMTVSRGCPFKCAFCTQAVWGSHATFNSGKRIFEELENCIEKFKIKEIWFRDDTFTSRKRDVLEFCNLIIEKNLKIRWTIFTRVDTVDEEMIEILKKAGCYKIDFGVECGDQEILNFMKKGITIEKIRETFAICRKIGMQTHAFIMIGYPRETKETIEKTMKLTLEIADWASFNPVSIIRGTELYDLAVKEGYFTPRKMDFLTGESERENFCESKELPKEEVLRLTNLAYKRFYLRPAHIARLLILMIKDGTIWNFIKISPYVLKRIFGKFERVKW